MICLTKTRLSDRNLNLCSLSGYCLFYCNSKTKAGGSAIYVSDCIDCQQLDNVKNNGDGCEHVWVKLNFNKNESLIVGAICRHPFSKIKLFEDAFVNVIKPINPNYIALGDYNINNNKGASSQNTSNYFNHMSSFGFLQLIIKPTRISKTSSTIINHIYIKTCLLNYASPVILYKDASDHLPVSTQLKLKQTKKLSKRLHIFKLNQEKKI